MSVSKHQLPASAYHIKPSDVRKLLLSTNNFRDRCLIKTLWWLGVRRSELTISMCGTSIRNANG